MYFNRQNRALATIQAELGDAKRGQKAECTKIGPRCDKWIARVDQLPRKPRAWLRRPEPPNEAIAKLATLAGFNGEKAQEIVRLSIPCRCRSSLSWVPCSSSVLHSGKGEISNDLSIYPRKASQSLGKLSRQVWLPPSNSRKCSREMKP
jgi:hypothetical protein